MTKYQIRNQFNGTNGYRYCGTWDGMYHFSKPTTDGHLHIKCREKDLINNNIIDMLKLDVTF